MESTFDLSDELPYFEYYGEINNGAHRKAADLIGGPAFIWHQAFWNPVGVHRSASARSASIRSMIESLYHARDRAGGATLSDRLIVEDDDRARVITVMFEWHGLACSVRFEIHTEYFSATSTIDASVKLADEKNHFSSEVQFYLNAFREQRWEASVGGETGRPSARGVHDYIYRFLWERRFYPEILKEAFQFEEDGSFKSRDIGRKFADLRGLITCEPYPDIKDGEPISDFSEAELLDRRIVEPFYRDYETDRRKWQRVKRLSPRWARARLNEVWPFLVMTPLDRPPALTGRSEFTVSRILDGLAIYATALGPQPKTGSTKEDQPLLFYLHSATQCERQIGRTVDRLMHLGTVRLAAIIALVAFKEISSFITVVERHLSAARFKIHALISAVKRPELTGPSDTIFSLEKDVVDQLSAIENLVGEISRGSSRYNDHLGDSTLEYRLARSAYYREQFENQVDSLRILRLEGYQPYKQFVTRRMRSVFGFIEEIDRRLEGIKHDRRSIDQLYLATSVTILTSKIEAQQVTAVRSQIRVEQLQEIAEKALFLVLGPYYAAMIATHILALESVGEIIGLDKTFEGHIFNLVINSTIWMVCLLGGMLTLRRITKQRRTGRRKKPTTKEIRTRPHFSRLLFWRQQRSAAEGRPQVPDPDHPRVTSLDGPR